DAERDPGARAGRQQQRREGKREGQPFHDSHQIGRRPGRLERRSGTLSGVRTTTRFLALVFVLPFLPGGCFGTQQRTVTPPARNATAALQAALDRGGRIFLPRLPDGKCYRTRGLWVSRSGTELTSNGACLEAIRPGPVRLQSPDGDPITSSAVLFISRAAGGLRPLLV